MNALILVDLQNDFLPGGALAVPTGDEVIPVADELQRRFDLVVATKDWHPSDHGSFAANHPGKEPGDRIILVTDGVTEAENARGDMFESERLEAVAGTSSSMDDILAAVADFCGGTPLNDDCTVVELVYSRI